MPGRVPFENYKMFDDVNSIHQAVIDKYGGPLYAKFDTILSKVTAEGHIEDFHPFYRPANLSTLNSSDHFRGFPYGGDTAEWYVDQVFDIIIC